MDIQDGGGVDGAVEALRRSTLFHGLPVRDCESIVRIGRRVSPKEGESIEADGEAYLIIEGSVEVSGGGDDPGRVLAGPGALLNEKALFGAEASKIALRALEDAELLTIPAYEFRTLMGGDSMALRLLGGMFGPQLDGEGNGGRFFGGPVTAVSRAVQRAILPSEVPQVSGFDIAAGTSLTDFGEGGTVWDHLTLADGRRALAALSVKGGSLPPAVHLAIVRALLRDAARDAGGLAELLRRVNEKVTESEVAGASQFVECGVMVPSGSTISWMCAGRIPGAVIRRDGSFEEFPSHGPPLGMMPGFRYGANEVAVGAGDAIFALSNVSTGVFRGAADLVATLQGKPVAEVVSLLHKAIRKAHEGSAETTVLFMRRH